MTRDEIIKWLMAHTVCLDGLTLLMVDEEELGLKHGPLFEQQRKEAAAFLRRVGAMRPVEGEAPGTERLSENEAELLFGRWRPWAIPGTWPPVGKAKKG